MLKIKLNNNLLNKITNNLFTPRYSSSAENLDIDNKNEPHLQQQQQQKVTIDTIIEEKPLINEPFIKSLYGGNWIYDYLKFPQYSTNKELNNITDNYLLPLTNSLNDNKSNTIINDQGYYTSSSLEAFRSLHLFDQSIPVPYGGSNLDSTGRTRLIEEISTLNPNLSIQLLYQNELVVRAIVKHGTIEHKEKYLNKIATGQIRTGFCYSEQDNGMDISRFKTIAQEIQVGDSKSDIKYKVNGEKSWISLLTPENEKTINETLLIVPLQVKQMYKQTSKVNIFVINSKQEGVTIKKQQSNSNGLHLYQIHFKDVILTQENQLNGSDVNSFDIYTELVDSARHFVGAICVGLLKNVLATVCDHVRTTVRFSENISTFKVVQKRLANIERRLFAMESMTYMTAGIFDTYQIPDISVEGMLTKIFCTEALNESILDCYQVF
jgi:acyl-CoA dehydrogenase family member 9